MDVMKKIENLWYLDIFCPPPVTDIWLGIWAPPLGRKCSKSPRKVGNMSIEPPPWKPRGGYKWICGTNLKLPVSEPPPLNSRGGGVQMNVDRYEYVKMFSQSEPPPKKKTEGGLQMKVGRWDYTNFFSQTEPPPYKFLDPPLPSPHLNSRGGGAVWNWMLTCISMSKCSHNLSPPNNWGGLAAKKKGGRFLKNVETPNPLKFCENFKLFCWKSFFSPFYHVWSKNNFCTFIKKNISQPLKFTQKFNFFYWKSFFY